MTKIVRLTESDLIKLVNRVLKEESERPDNFDKCVICGKETPYLRSTHIDLREGYVEGGGQGCYQPNICGK